MDQLIVDCEAIRIRATLVAIRRSGIAKLRHGGSCIWVSRNWWLGRQRPEDGKSHVNSSEANRKEDEVAKQVRDEAELGGNGMSMQGFGERIRGLRIRKGFTQQDLGEALGVTAQAVSKWENGIAAPDISLLVRLAQVFDVSMDALFGLEPLPSPLCELESKEGQSSEVSGEEEAGGRIENTVAVDLGQVDVDVADLDVGDVEVNMGGIGTEETGSATNAEPSGPTQSEKSSDGRFWSDWDKAQWVKFKEDMKAAWDPTMWQAFGEQIRRAVDPERIRKEVEQIDPERIRKEVETALAHVDKAAIRESIRAATQAAKKQAHEARRHAQAVRDELHKSQQYCSSCDSYYPVEMMHCASCHENYRADEHHCMGCHDNYGDDVQHCLGCHENYGDDMQHCLGCHENYGDDEIHCLGCHENYDKNEQHCMVCHENYDMDEQHCPECHENYGTDEQHCTLCHENYDQSEQHCTSCHETYDGDDVHCAACHLTYDPDDEHHCPEARRFGA